VLQVLQTSLKVTLTALKNPARKSLILNGATPATPPPFRGGYAGVARSMTIRGVANNPINKITKPTKSQKD
jgi:hypothetical protein